ncbi:MAG: tRNA pseudouridine(55) synthase TruB [Desulfovibrio sp.]|uniref:tRNA pseudouridine(55) synthase TruB n=1 Tax=Desulfovibrio sp. TaxID=885 RepID=UPI001A6AF249|nr:tRNA pseudouridine(55) synthase TruB [Desulfovibrio sp.]MBD5418056.1 tRNA pseudouridine(55) synthase TruB [Desulfovibrio sp.]
MTEQRAHPPTPLPQLDGVLVLDKPTGPTSARCVAALKRLGQKKIGHAGTLDPLASGVLLILLGQATKLSSFLMEGGGKVYRGCLRLGQTTDTWDSQGEVMAEAPWQHVAPEDVARDIASWTALTEQPVPPYSAAKHEGQPLYRLARRGRTAPAKTKAVKISQAAALEVSLPFVRFRVACGSGTYVRSLAHSLGMRLGCGAVLTELTREYSHPFGLGEATGLDALVADPALLAARVRPLADALPAWPRLLLTREQERRVRNGMALPVSAVDSGDAARDAGHALLCAADGTALALARREMTPLGDAWAVARGLW